MQTVSLTNQAKGRISPAHDRKEQADDRHLEHAEMKNPPIDSGTQKVWDGTFLTLSECLDLDLALLKWT